MAVAARFENVDIVFGPNPKKALQLLDAGQSRAEILQATGQVLGVAGASLTIEKGEISVLMGLSGSGKSTLLRCLNGLNRASRGRVLVYDQGQDIDLTRCDGVTLRRLRMQRVAMVFQQFALLPWRTVEENVGLGLELRGMPEAQRRSVVHEKLELVGLAPWAHKYAHELSGGMQQRVGLARAFATDADVLLMDEPFSALDPLIREHLQGELLELQRKLQKTIVFVSHDLDEALRIGTHITIMEAGRIVQTDVPEQIVLNPANPYVRAFVAHMNPVKVLRGASLMTGQAALKTQEGARLALDWTGQHLIELSASGQLQAATIGGKPAQLLPYHAELNLDQVCADGQSYLLAPPDMLLEKIIQLRHASGRPVLLCEGERFVGVVGDDEIYAGMLRIGQAAP